MGDYFEELMFIKQQARIAWGKIAPLYDGALLSEKKEDGSIVTQADKIANQYLLDRIHEKYPLDGLVSEESKDDRSGTRTWYIDPIDGTRGFFHRNGQFAIHIGLCEGDSPVVGIVYWASTDETYFGVKGEGSYRENSRGIQQLKVVSPDLNDLVAVISRRSSPQKDQRDFYNRLNVDKFRVMGSEGLRYMKIAENKADLRISEQTPPSTWDVCAPQLVLEEAGGKVQFLDGSPILYTGQRGLGKFILAARTPELAEKVSRIYSEYSLNP